MDQLSRPWLDENSNDGSRRAFTDTTAKRHLEAVERDEREAMGFSETRYMKGYGEINIVLWRPLLLDSHVNVRQQSHFKTHPGKSRPRQLP